jgi:primosomal protein N' (replication factor Y)
MFIIEVLPITKAIGKETLSYFSPAEIKVGSMVSIPLRNKKIKGIVVTTTPAIEKKSEIKKLDFQVKKVDDIQASKLISPQFMKVVQRTALHFATTKGAILSILIPKELLESRFLTEVHNEQRQDKVVIQGDDEERVSYYKTLIRQEFAKKKSVTIVVPSHEDATYIYERLSKGIEDYIYVLNSAQKKTIELMHRSIHPVLAIVTAPYLSVIRNDTATIIIEKENGRGYRTMSRPYIDLRIATEFFAEETNCRLVIGDIFLRTETLSKHALGEYFETTPFKFRSLSTASEILVDMKAYKSSSGAFRILSEQAEVLIKETKEQSEHMFVFATRRGLAPSVVCGDCQTVVTCNRCSAPIVLHSSKQSEKTFFLCHHCGDRRSSEEYCKNCQSWKLGTVGIGINLVAEKIKDKFPDVKTFIIDSDTAKTDKAARDIVQKFRFTPGSILIGTEMALSYLHEPVQNILVASMDSLLALPDFRIHEKILYTITRMRSLATQSIILQTRSPQEKVFQHALKGNLIDFYREHIEERKQFNYPPFSTLIKITLTGKKDAIVAEMQELQTLLSPHEIDVFPAFTHTVRGLSVIHGLIRVHRLDDTLSQTLARLPQHIVIKIDPESLL